MLYEVYRQESRPFPVLDKPWEFICYTEDDASPGDYDWGKIVRALTGESLAEQSAKGFWWKVISSPDAEKLKLFDQNE